MIAADGCSLFLQLLVGRLGPVKKCVVLQVSDAAVRIRLYLCLYGTARLYTDYRTDWLGKGERGEGCHPSDLLCWLTVIWSGAPTDSLGEGPQVHKMYIVAAFLR